ncbi:hypothetical protein GCM10010191_58060 [Actinomadura vinacea]|uniref:Uncharacterized protein n=1 Tax=Actinomadura vinacea TaxID=115336 RepID=A0ABN3JRJ6_9ACTN
MRERGPTRWARELLDEAAALLVERRYRSALRCVLVVFDVHPDLPEARRLASEIVYLGARDTTDAEPEERVGPQEMDDSRLNAIYSACEAPGCALAWMSAHHMLDGRRAVIRNARGGRCDACKATFCNRHARAGGDGLACPRCGGALDLAPPPNGRRWSGRTKRLNKPLAHVFVLVEGAEPPSAGYLTEMCRNLIPEVFEDEGVKISANCALKFRDDGQMLAMTCAAQLDSAYLTDAYDMRVSPGEKAGPDGHRWVIVKIFENRPKHVDPDAG